MADTRVISGHSITELYESRLDYESARCAMHRFFSPPKSSQLRRTYQVANHTTGTLLSVPSHLEDNRSCKHGIWHDRGSSTSTQQAYLISGWSADKISRPGDSPGVAWCVLTRRPLVCLFSKHAPRAPRPVGTIEHALLEEDLSSVVMVPGTSRGAQQVVHSRARRVHRGWRSCNPWVWHDRGQSIRNGAWHFERCPAGSALASTKGSPRMALVQPMGLARSRTVYP